MQVNCPQVRVSASCVDDRCERHSVQQEEWDAIRAVVRIASLSPQVGLHPALTTKTKVSSDLCGHWVRSLCRPTAVPITIKVGEVAQQHPSKIPKGKPFVPVRLRLPVYNQNFDNWPSIRRRVLTTEEAGDTAALWRVSPRHVCIGVFDPFSVLGVFAGFFYTRRTT